MTDKEADKRPEDETEDDEEDDAEDDEHTDGASTVSSTKEGGDSSSKKKKKKKKKKKGKGAQSTPAAAEGAQASQGASQPALTKAQKAEAEKKFTSALDACRGATEMWVDLSNSHVYDAKAKKLADALKANSCITSLDLSRNNIADDGAQALASMLTGSGAPELIELDLRENPLSPAAVQALEALRKSRKQLVVKLGAIPPPEPEKPPQQQPAAKGSSGAASAEGAGGKGASSPGMKEMMKGPMFRKYFQTGDDDDEAGGGQGEADGPLGDGGLAPEQLWSELKSLVAAGTGSIPKLSALLQQLIEHLNREIGTLQQVPHTDAAVDGSRPHIKGCIMHLDTLGAILDLVPRKVMLQGETEPQLAVGSHRVWATEILSMLLAPNHTALDNLVAASQLVPKTLALCLAHPSCSALHTRALRILRCCCVSKVERLYGPLFTPGLGAGLKKTEGSGGAEEGAGGEGGAEGEEPCGSLQQQLAERASPSLGVPSGRRNPSVGFVLEACKVLRACCDEANRDSIFNTNVRRLLLMDPKWSEFVSEGGVLAQLCKEQEGDLGGPRAARMPLEDSAELAELAGGGLISSHEILALLHGMQLGMPAGGGEGRREE
ncbi:hypothetical protein Agub_g8036 [Astrephomene gubernaculifera]|uniref:Uncharacterized protein n=1 Tax=Astrephomene gubernaculifera TaxID=47775 RepID=A0AAD3HMW9_9CHLO|nr:hypothetical protein Agub_g8036 [Astrephomene gubernaculifera]